MLFDCIFHPNQIKGLSMQLSEKLYSKPTLSNSRLKILYKQTIHLKTSTIQLGRKNSKLSKEIIKYKTAMLKMLQIKTQEYL